MDTEKKPVLAMYDVRGIQNYIYKTARVQDAVGASIIVENIIIDALRAAEKSVCSGTGIRSSLEWFDEKTNTTLEYKDGEYDIQVLYIGGGNALVSYSSRELCIRFNKVMSKYVLENTYSLQLAIAITEKSERYDLDYKNIFKEMAEVKERMLPSFPLGTLPVMDVEIKTGLPKSKNVPVGFEYDRNSSSETYLKKLAAKKDEYRYKSATKFDSYIEKKGDDSMLAVIHADGNNMGLRIRSLIEGISNYTEAVNKMRKISFQINNSYKTVYEEMERIFNQNGKENNILKILVAGDDITYICKGKYAIASVEYLARETAKNTMNGQKDAESLKWYGFSICAGIAYIHSHFPFSIGYEVAESCCESAKTKAKQNQMKDKETAFCKVGNWVDFQFCRNVQAEDLERTREREYVSPSGENLLIRPYELPLLKLPSRENAYNRIEVLKNSIAFLQKGNSESQDNKAETEKVSYLPKRHIKRLRNLYSEGKTVVKEFEEFLKSRNWKMPDSTVDMYYEEDNTAKWYDAIELMDYYVSLEEIEQAMN